MGIWVMIDGEVVHTPTEEETLFPNLPIVSSGQREVWMMSLDPAHVRA